MKVALAPLLLLAAMAEGAIMATVNGPVPFDTVAVTSEVRAGQVNALAVKARSSGRFSGAMVIGAVVVVQPFASRMVIV